MREDKQQKIVSIERYQRPDFDGFSTRAVEIIDSAIHSLDEACKGTIDVIGIVKAEPNAADAKCAAYYGTFSKGTVVNDPDERLDMIAELIADELTSACSSRAEAWERLQVLTKRAWAARE